MQQNSTIFFLTIISISPFEVHCQLVSPEKVENIIVQYKKNLYEKYKFIYSQLNHNLLHNLCDHNEIQLKDILISFIDNKIYPLPIELKEFIPF